MINFLEGYAGLRLKGSKPLEVKKGLNLIVGRNGSGKSNLTSLITFIFNSDHRPSKKLFESSFQDAIMQIASKNYEVQKVNDSNNGHIRAASVGEHPFCKFEFNGTGGNVSIKAEHDIPDQHFFRWVKEIGFAGNGFKVVVDPELKLKVSDIKPQIHLDNSDMHVLDDKRLFGAPNGANPVVQSIVNNFNTFFADRVAEFQTNDKALLQKAEELKANVLKEYNNFFEQTDKTVHITLDPKEFNGKALILKDGANIIAFESLSDGEKNLFNLIINLGTARGIRPDLIIFDEPEIFMHDDMIRTLVKEITKLSEDIPNTCIIVSTHSSVLIQEMAEHGKGKVNLISITDKHVANSDEDIDFINVLSHNGVRFSPLFISKKPNLFIENSGEEGEQHKLFYLSFFEPNRQPNIIPIGSSGQVKTYHNQVGIIENILQTQTTHRTIGIMDGDMWIVNYLHEYLEDKLNLVDFIKLLHTSTVLYIQNSEAKSGKVYFFNFWEIENLYLLDELLSTWKFKNGEATLSKQDYIAILRNLKSMIIDSWSRTYQRFLFPPIYIRDLQKFDGAAIDSKIKAFNDSKDEIVTKLEAFFEALFVNDLLHWMPGKEVCNILKQTHTFDLVNFDPSNLNITKNVRSILQ